MSQNNILNLNHIYIINSLPCLVVKITPKTAFFQPCKLLASKTYSTDITFFCCGERDTYKTYSNTQPEEGAGFYKKLIRNINPNDRIYIDINDIVFKNDILRPNLKYSTCEEMQNEPLTTVKYLIHRELAFLWMGQQPRERNSNNLKLLAVERLKKLLLQHPNILPTIKRNKIDYVKEYNKYVSEEFINNLKQNNGERLRD